MILFGKAVLGGLIVVLMAILAKTKSFFIAGLIPLFPTFALIAHVLVYNDQGPVGVKETAIFGIYALIPYFAYLFGVILFVDKYNIWTTLGFSTIIWFVVSGLLIYLKINHLLPGFNS